ARRAQQVLDEALALLEAVTEEGLVKAIGRGVFAGVSRPPEGGKGLEGVIERAAGYCNPFEDLLSASESAVTTGAFQSARSSLS
ncbi:MAG: hypothetical protein KGR26_15815, partial [Cyanobacteria bacterium REEB65]|nr:hypothetical protein [Cyanobacteria bacterium REEB65]